PVLELQVLELRLLLVLVGHGAGELVPVLLDGQGGLPLLPADLVLALPRPDRVRLGVLRAREDLSDQGTPNPAITWGRNWIAVPPGALKSSTTVTLSPGSSTLSPPGCRISRKGFLCRLTPVRFTSLTPGSSFFRTSTSGPPTGPLPRLWI